MEGSYLVHLRRKLWNRKFRENKRKIRKRKEKKKKKKEERKKEEEKRRKRDLSLVNQQFFLFCYGCFFSWHLAFSIISQLLLGWCTIQMQATNLILQAKYFADSATDYIFLIIKRKPRTIPSSRFPWCFSGILLQFVMDSCVRPFRSVGAKFVA